MSYQEQAIKINDVLKSRLSECAIQDKKLINAILWFGQVAKYRCRSNVAYDNFANMCFEGIVELERKPLEGQEFEVLQVK